MASQAQINANRQNAKKSTGPRTPEGKAKAARNTIKHGLTAHTAVIPGEDPADYDDFREKLLSELFPKGPMETLLADRIIELSWRLKRSGRLQVGVFEKLMETRGIGKNKVDAAELGRMTISDFSQNKVLDRLLMHERRIEHSLYKTMLELQRLQFIRTKYQSLLMDHEDYDDCDHRRLDEQYRQKYPDMYPPAPNQSNEPVNNN